MGLNVIHTALLHRHSVSGNRIIYTPSHRLRRIGVRRLPTLYHSLPLQPFVEYILHPGRRSFLWVINVFQRIGVGLLLAANRFL